MALFPIVDLTVDADDVTDRGLLKATLAAVTRLESQMSQMNEAIGRLTTAVTEQRDRMQGQIDALTSALEAERTEAQRLAEAEAIEDVGQDQALADARSATDAALAELQGGVEQVNRLADEVTGVQQPEPGPEPQPGPEPGAPDFVPEPDQPAPLPEDPNSEQPVSPSVPPGDQPVQ